MTMRIGHGYDVHACGQGTHIVLGGTTIECGFGLIAHSDGDVVLHALCDALLGAAGLGDIGRHFPDTDEQFRGVDSRGLLHIGSMQVHIASDLGVDVGAVNVKATTTERLGFEGRSEGIASYAVALIVQGGDGA